MYVIESQLKKKNAAIHDAPVVNILLFQIGALLTQVVAQTVDCSSVYTIEDLRCKQFNKLYGCGTVETVNCSLPTQDDHFAQFNLILSAFSSFFSHKCPRCTLILIEFNKRRRKQTHIKQGLGGNESKHRWIIHMALTHINRQMINGDSPSLSSIDVPDKRTDNASSNNNVTYTMELQVHFVVWVCLCELRSTITRLSKERNWNVSENIGEFGYRVLSLARRG